jgi:hypothetical protein
MRALAPLAMGRANKVPGQGFKYVVAKLPRDSLAVFQEFQVK